MSWSGEAKRGSKAGPEGGSYEGGRHGTVAGGGEKRRKLANSGGHWNERRFGANAKKERPAHRRANRVAASVDRPGGGMGGERRRNSEQKGLDQTLGL